ncbi:DUF3052 domain-containing protein [Sediminivirga luteola]|jgi:hypothetical protein|uniref:DUF3052 family protein n=1 Tax=Sediminivirga luteola TaxID=1774748 RepID=A0A8J2TWR0_9MICO|nr:DUF3052 domain-containing protein [Sediminivirga luteola]MCI2263970.1 DUF3052 domain-containing protein [Sediminivirga luteola]GGA09076.1 hypothetical protein GCM10011333_10060 [Sediminivirga luteola]
MNANPSERTIAADGESTHRRHGELGENLQFTTGSLIQELGYDDDVDFDLREALEDITGEELLDEDADEVVDGVILWWRDGDGDLVDALVDAQATLDEGAVVWLLTPKARRDGHVSPAEVAEAAPTAGLHVTKTLSAAEDWAATRLVNKKTYG